MLGEVLHELLSFHQEHFYSQLIDIFSAFAIVREFLKSKNFGNSLLPHVVLMLYQLLKKCVISHSGSRTTEEAGKTSKIVARIINQSQNESESNGWKTSLALIQARDLSLQNIFFRINWNIILGVSSFIYKI